MRILALGPIQGALWGGLWGRGPHPGPGFPPRPAHRPTTWAAVIERERSDARRDSAIDGRPRPGEALPAGVAWLGAGNGAVSLGGELTAS